MGGASRRPPGAAGPGVLHNRGPANTGAWYLGLRHHPFEPWLTCGLWRVPVGILAIWGWIELAFLTGAITGPNVYDCPDDTPEWERFIRAWGTIAYHEMLLVGVLVLIWIYGHGAINSFGLWTFTILYIARISAKLNLFYGVPRINTEFIPDALRTCRAISASARG